MVVRSHPGGVNSTEISKSLNPTPLKSKMYLGIEDVYVADMTQTNSSIPMVTNMTEQDRRTWMWEKDFRGARAVNMWGVCVIKT